MNSSSPLTVPDVVFGAVALITPASITQSIEGAEALFYSFLKHGVQPYGRAYNWIRETALERISLIQTIFNAASIGTLIYYGSILDQNIPTFFFAPIRALPHLGIDKKVALIGGSIGACAAAFLISPLFAPQINPPSTENNIRSREEQSWEQKIAQYLQTVKMIFNMAMLALPSQRLLASLRLICVSYSFWKNRSLKWMVFNKTTDREVLERIGLEAFHRVDTKYKAMICQEVGTECAICFESDSLINVAACANHLFHKTCLQAHVNVKLDESVAHSNYTVVITNRYVDGVYTGKNYSCKVETDVSRTPFCPECRDFPIQNSLNFSVSGRGMGQLPTTVKIVKPPRDRGPLFDKCHSLYNITQTALTYLQTYHELTFSIFCLQKWMIPLDAFCLITDISYLIAGLEKEEKWQDFKLRHPTFAAYPEKIQLLMVRVAAAVATVAMGALFYFFIHQLNLFLRPHLSLKGISQQLVHPDSILDVIKVDWTNPFIQEMLQTLSLMRLCVSAARGLLSKERRSLHFMNIVAHLTSFIGLSRLRFVELQAILPQAINALGIKDLILNSTFMVDRAKSLSVPFLTSSLQPLVEKIGGVVEGGFVQLFSNPRQYLITLQHSPFNRLSSSSAHLVEFSLTVKNIFYKLIETKVAHPWTEWSF